MPFFLTVWSARVYADGSFGDVTWITKAPASAGNRIFCFAKTKEAAISEFRNGREISLAAVRKGFARNKKVGEAFRW